MTALLIYALWAHLLGLGVLALIPARGLDDKIGLRHSLAGPVGMTAFLWAGLLTHVLGARVTLVPFLLLTGFVLFLGGCFGGLKAIFPLTNSTGPSGRAPSALRWRGYEMLLLSAILFQAGYILFETFWRPVALDDDWSQWASNAKLLYTHGILSSTYFRQGNLSFYPQFLTLNEVLFSMIHGGWSDFLCKSFLTLLFFYFTAFSVAWLDLQFRSRTLGLFFALLILTIPTFVRVGLDGTAELPMMFFLGFTAGLLLLADRSSGRRYSFLLPGIFAGGVAGIKSEGLYAVIAMVSTWVLVSLWRRRLRLKDLLLLLLPVLLVTLPWQWLLAELTSPAGGPETTRFNSFSLLWLLELNSYQQMLSFAISACFTLRNSLFLGFYFVIALLHYLFRCRNDTPSLLLFLILSGIAAAYALGCYSTGWPEQFARLLTHLSGIVLLFIIRQTACSLAHHYPERFDREGLHDAPDSAKSQQR